MEEPEPEGDNNDDNDDTVSETATAVDDEPAGQASSSQNLAVSQEVIAGARLPSGWNSRGEDSYTFEYKHEQSGLKFIVRVGRMGGRVNVSGMAEVRLACWEETVSQSSFPPHSATGWRTSSVLNSPQRARQLQLHAMAPS